MKTPAIAALVALVVARSTATYTNGTNATHTASAQCSGLSTVYIPVTETVTTVEYIVSSGASPAIVSSSPTTALSTVATTTVFYTDVTTVTVTPPEAAPSFSSGQGPYSFVMVGTSTSWISGVSPSSGASLIIEATTFTVRPQPAVVSTPSGSRPATFALSSLQSTTSVSFSFESTIPTSAISQWTTTHTTLTTTSTTTLYTTVSLQRMSWSSTSSQSNIASSATTPLPTPTVAVPPSTTTIFRLMSPDLTTTVTSTQYTTISLSAVSSHSSFAGMMSGGWNASSTGALAESAVPITRTMTELFYLGAGNDTTSTGTTYITTTADATITQTIIPPAVTTNISGSPVTIHAIPSTIVYVVSLESSAFSTSISFGGDSTIESMTALSSTPTASVASSAISADQSGKSHAGSPNLTPTSPSGLGASPSTFATGVTEALSTTVAGIVSNSSSSASGHAPILTTSTVDGRRTTVTVEGTLIETDSYSSDSVDSKSSLLVPDASILMSSSTTVSRTGLSASNSGIQTSRTGVVRTTISLGYTRSLPSSATSHVNSTTSLPTAELTPTEVMSHSTLITTAAVSPSGTPSRVNTSPLSSQHSFSSAATISAGTSESMVSASFISRPSSRSSLSGHSSSSSNTASGLTSTTAVTASVSRLTSITSTAPLSHDMTTVTSTSSARASSTNDCGEQGPVTMTFDDLPIYKKRQASWNQTTNGTDITQYPAIDQFRPYHHMLFSEGYVYAPKAAEPFSPISPPNVAAFVDPMRAGSPFNRTGQNNLQPGELGDGENDRNMAFWFDPENAYVGCDNAGPDDCTMEATGFVWDPTTRAERPDYQQNYTLPPCVAYKNCQLQQVQFPSTFKGLSGLQFRAVVNQQPRMFFVDNMAMRWSDNSCQAGRQRASHSSFGKPH